MRLTEAERAELARLSNLADEEHEAEKRSRREESERQRRQGEAAIAAVQTARKSLAIRCLGDQTMPSYVSGSEGFDVLPELLRMSLACIDALEKRIDLVEKMTGYKLWTG